MLLRQCGKCSKKEGYRREEAGEEDPRPWAWDNVHLIIMPVVGEFASQFE